MSERFGEYSTTDEVLDGIDLSGCRILVTGTSAGLGVETARALVSRGAFVVGTVRHVDRAAAATQPIHLAARAGTGSFELVPLDLADLASVRACANTLIADRRRFDVVICNAGVMAPPFGRTADGFETQFGTNHLGHFVLVNQMASTIVPGGRVVMLSSAGHRYADVDLEDPDFDRTPYSPMIGYGRSKTANILFAVAFDRRHLADDIRATAVHPGAIRTQLSRHMNEADRQKLIQAINEQNAAAGAAPLRYKTVSEGAATTVWAAVVAPPSEIGGRYCEDCRVALPSPGPDVRIGVQRYALDPSRAEALWALSERMTAEH
jgi:NAD(P)-dependent dehydrogenase (short-subunit alcohol dehydrogenase family)